MNYSCRCKGFFEYLFFRYSESIFKTCLYDKLTFKMFRSFLWNWRKTASSSVSQTPSSPSESDFLWKCPYVHINTQFEFIIHPFFPKKKTEYQNFRPAKIYTHANHAHPHKCAEYGVFSLAFRANRIRRHVQRVRTPFFPERNFFHQSSRKLQSTTCVTYHFPPICACFFLLFARRTHAANSIRGIDACTRTTYYTYVRTRIMCRWGAAGSLSKGEERKRYNKYIREYYIYFREHTYRRKRKFFLE